VPWLGLCAHALSVARDHGFDRHPHDRFDHSLGFVDSADVPERKITRLRLAREAALASQRELAELAGIPIATYRRLERGEIRNPSVRLLVNCAIVLFRPVEELLDDEWLEWMPIDRAEPPPVAERLPAAKALPRRRVKPEWTTSDAPARAAVLRALEEEEAKISPLRQRRPSSRPPR
jgi:transcriptional regulator with XRE-family HTH domain